MGLGYPEGEVDTGQPPVVYVIVVVIYLCRHLRTQVPDLPKKGLVLRTLSQVGDAGTHFGWQSMVAP